ncbi:MAG: two-component system, OmpR family, sensor histidine kinase ResE [Bacillota bacterium]|nr:two-component system, OmpR family, sensor histidine kinase ResE [Bacillota bacterium]MDK2925296.1 two-component system, OmpR family, sensor histidine kinase ResE [Bacillota bacterium]
MRPRLPRTLFGKLLLSYLAVALITLLAVGITTSRLFAGFYYSVKEKELLQQGQQVAAALQSSSGTTRENLRALSTHLRDIPGSRLIVLDRTDLASSISRMPPGRTIPPLDKETIQKVLSGEVVSGRVGFGQDILRAVIPLKHQGEVTGALVIFTPLADIAATIKAVQRLIINAAGIAVLFAVLLGSYLSRSISRPLKEMSRISLAMAEGNFKQQVPVTSGDEVGQLAQNFNHLAIALDRTIGALWQEKRKIESILANMSEGVIAVDEEGRVLFSNPAVGRTLGGNPSPIPEGTTIDSLGCPELVKLFGEVLKNKESRSGELALNGGKTCVIAHVTPLAQPGEPLSGAVAVLEDITELKQVEQLRRDFVANVSHELRTPLTSIQGFVEALLDGVAGDPKHYLEVIYRETLRLKALINDILELSLLQSGRIEWELNAVDVGDLAARVAFKLGQEIQAKGLTVKEDIPPDLPCILANEDRVEQVLTNFLSNAIRYSPPGATITIRGRFGIEGVTVSVEDQGPGIPAEELPRIWERFYRLEKSRSRALGGTGLGLAIAKEIIEAHGGRVGATSEVGRGSTFWFTLPAVPPETEKENPGQQTSRV